MMKENTVRKISFVQTWIWILLLLPLSAIFFMMGVATIMVLDSGTGGPIKTALIIASCGLFWGTPLLAISGVAVSFYFRKKGRPLHAVLIQLTPIASAFLAFLFLGISFQ